MACVSSPQWELLLVLKALVMDPYEPHEHSCLQALTFKTAVMLALTSAKRMCELTALLVIPYFGVTAVGLL